MIKDKEYYKNKNIYFKENFEKKIDENKNKDCFGM